MMMKLSSSESHPTSITSSAIEKMLSYKGKVVSEQLSPILFLCLFFAYYCLNQVSKTFVAKTMKMIDKDNSGEVDVDEMVCCRHHKLALCVYVRRNF
jgi:hypothetical protein